MSKREVRLALTSDWDQWIYAVRSKATGYRVWPYIDPVLTPKPKQMEEPMQPVLDIPNGLTPTQAAEIRRDHKEQKSDWKEQQVKWEHIHDGLSKIIDFIHDSVAVGPQAFLQHVKEIHPWDLLHILQDRNAPPDSARKLEVERLYGRLKVGP